MSPTPRAARGRSVRRGWSAHCGVLWKTKRDANADARRGGLDRAYPVALLDLRAEAVEGYANAVVAILTSREAMLHTTVLERHDIAAKLILAKLLGPLPKRGKAKGEGEG